MTPNEVMVRWRADVVDTAQPYLWSEDDAWGYLNDAYVMFWRLVGGIPDFLTPLVCSVPITAGNAVGALHPSILRIMSASRASDGGEIKILNSTDLGALPLSDYGLIRELKLDDKQGPVRFGVIGMADDVIRWVNVPLENDTCKLIVYRKPLDRITIDSEEFGELNEDHHIHLLDWMKHLAYGKQDAETFDKGRADEFGGKFEAYCALVKSERERAKHKTRVVQYGGI